jgi:regulator of replication initiation timing
MSFQDVIAKMDRLEQKIDQMLKDNIAIHIEITQLKKRLDAIEPVAKQAAKDSAPMRIIGGPTLRSNHNGALRVRELIEKGKASHNPKETKSNEVT